ncbi:hypothetical protein AB0I10_32320 [Streptomyces sp. NPDC050636]
MTTVARVTAGAGMAASSVQGKFEPLPRRLRINEPVIWEPPFA